MRFEASTAHAGKSKRQAFSKIHKINNQQKAAVYRYYLK